MNPEHPKAQMARLEAAQRRNDRADKKRCIALAKKDHNIQFLTIGLYTICYRVDRRNVIEISTTLLHPNDRFDKIIGQYSALDRFTANHRVHLRVPNGIKPRDFLQTHFHLMQLT